jgi:hypothetical protein
MAQTREDTLRAIARVQGLSSAGPHAANTKPAVLAGAAQKTNPIAPHHEEHPSIAANSCNTKESLSCSKHPKMDASFKSCGVQCQLRSSTPLIPVLPSALDRTDTVSNEEAPESIATSRPKRRCVIQWLILLLCIF